MNGALAATQQQCLLLCNAVLRLTSLLESQTALHRTHRAPRIINTRHAQYIIPTSSPYYDNPSKLVELYRDKQHKQPKQPKPKQLKPPQQPNNDDKMDVDIERSAPSNNPFCGLDVEVVQSKEVVKRVDVQVQEAPKKVRKPHKDVEVQVSPPVTTSPPSTSTPTPTAPPPPTPKPSPPPFIPFQEWLAQQKREKEQQKQTTKQPTQHKRPSQPFQLVQHKRGKLLRDKVP